MKINLIRNLSFCLFAYLLICLLNAPVALAQTSPQKGITEFPSIAHIDLSTDAPEYNITYVNNTSSDITLNLSVQDFNELEESYKINFLEKKDASNYKYSLSSWISFENKNIQLSPKESRSVKIFIDKSRITKGGHYASILAEIVQPDTKKQVNVKGVLSSLLFVRASTGKEIENGKINSFKPQREGLEFPESFIIRFENNGNVHVVPHGIIEVYDPFSNLVAKGILNEGSLDALPESIRRFETKVQANSKMLSPGIYSAKVFLRYGKSDQKVLDSTRFFSEGSFGFVKIALALIMILGAATYYRKKRSKPSGK